MKNRFPLLLLLVLCTTAICARGQSSVLPVNLRCEYLVNPLGIDELQPRLGWTLQATDSNAYGQRQTAYRILVASTAKELDSNKGTVWSTGWVTTDDMQHIDYKGRPLREDQRYYWKVSVKDEKGRVSDWSSTATWTTGLLQPGSWKATWIGSDEIFDPRQRDCNIADPWLRKTFDLKEQPQKANIFIASVGFHELYVNGKKIGDGVMAPAVTNHVKRARYVTYDIASALHPGKNVITLWLGTSWSIFGPYIAPGKPQTPIVIAQAAIYNKDAATPAVLLKTDRTWLTHPSPNKLLGVWDSNRMGGELWDASKEIDNWNTIQADESTWRAATEYHPRLLLSAQMTEPNKVMNEITPVAVVARPDGSFRVDMGVNFAGWTAIRVKGQPGDRIDFQFSEREQMDMTFGLHSAFIIGKEGHGEFRNHFNYSSGRWITIRGLKYKPSPDDIRGWLVRTAYEPATTFACSDSLQNWIYDRVRWTYENLSLGGYVVDCPQRERLGYGGDAHATCETGMFNYHLGAFYTKWMEDWRDVQGTESIVGNMYDTAWAHKGLMSGRYLHKGILPHTAPTFMGGGGPSWGGICVSLPWFLYQQEGDRRVLEKNFEMIKNWLAFLDTQTKDHLLMRFGGPWDFLGDWLWPGATAEGMNNDKPQTVCLNNCYRVFNLRTAAKIARVLGKNTAAVQWEQQAAEASNAINAKFYNAADHSYSDSSMANLAAALLAEVPPPAQRAAVMKRLETEILINRKGHIHVGITGGALLFKLLRDEGRDDLIYSMTSQTTYPGWGYMKANGATTIWEMWEKDLPGHSLLHSSYLYPGAWYINGVAGIRRDPQSEKGFRHFVIRPPLLTASQLSWAHASFASSAGEIKTAWQRTAGGITLQVTVPPNCTATVELPEAEGAQVKESSGHMKKKGTRNGYTLFELPAGNYTLRSMSSPG
ncbi:family 78 glycoside hydrolase catalytic domain [Chitinophaga ginsengisegetis]|uniref:family 78 glycoside hydrolase catalytic domain n=1 Tax=Chitinophaga ginsengisegetis TaxID=393003 RepID=UPI000DB9C43E|nr:family 78 glycoside hydrolase catalytic domain [Chitinophaga ginsengisegetis]MDR6568042.1 alpha-L-rhamnosidase [Chitinophaga ginsengisegetis]MDR6647403.1 alpha-L-rhamnosidase [Chitinophaga ginsengisegetis]MDR6653753.1 alpha-L-rhamnosidase [Chitinophaga ginsengisegetis]